MPNFKTPKKDCMVRALLDPDTHRKFSALMKKKGENQSGFVRRLIIDAIETDQVPRLTPGMEQQLKDLVKHDLLSRDGDKLSWTPHVGVFLTQAA
jgi:hypothetical protein